MAERNAQVGGVDDLKLRRPLVALRLAAGIGFMMALGGWGASLPPAWLWLLALAALHVLDPRPAGSSAESAWRQPLAWLRLHDFSVGLAIIIVIGVCVRLSAIDSDLGRAPVDVDENRLARTVVHFFQTGEVDHSTVENYPGLLFWLLSGSYLLVYLVALMEGVARNLEKVPFELFVLAGRVTNVMLEAGTILLTGLLGHRLGGRRAGLIAALVVAVTPLSVEVSSLLRNEAAQTFFLVGAISAAVMLAGGAEERRVALRGWGLPVLAGGLAGAATAVKYSGVFALLPCLVACVVSADGAPQELPSRRARRFVVALLAFFAVLATTNHFLWADFPNFIRQLSTEVRMSGEHHWAAQKNPAWFYSRILGKQGPGWMLLTLAAGYAVWGLAACRAVPLTLLTFPLSYVWFMTQRPSQFSRWVYPLAPIVAVAGATALCAVIDRVSRWLSEARRAPVSSTPWLMASLVVAALAQPLWRGVVVFSRRVATPTYGLTEAWLRERAAPGDRVLLEEGWLDLRGTALRLNRVPSLRTVLGGGMYPLCYNDWVVVPEHDLRQRSLERLRLVETFRARSSFGGSAGFDFAIYATPRLQPSDETVDFELDHEEARSYLGTDWRPPQAGSGGRSLPGNGASVYLPPRRYAARLDIELEVAVARDCEGAAVAPAPAGSVPAPIAVELEGQPLLDEKVTRSGSRVSWSSAPIAAGVLGRGVVQLRLTPVAAESTRIRVLRVALQR